MILSYLSMLILVVLSNYLVQFPINDWLTWAMFPYPCTFFVNELTNRIYGPNQARKVVYGGFVMAVILSFWVASPQIAFASGTAFLVAQLLDISLFSRLRNASWWVAPFVASFLASAVDTCIFWPLAFMGETSLPIWTWGFSDFLVKVACDLLLLTPYRYIIRKVTTPVALS